MGEMLYTAAFSVQGLLPPMAREWSVSSLVMVGTSLLLLALIVSGRCSHSGFEKDEAVTLLWAYSVGLFFPSRIFDLALFQVGDTLILLNLLGAGVPLVISVTLWTRDKLRLRGSVPILGVACFVAYEVSVLDPERGVVVQHFFLVPLVSALLAIYLYGPGDRETAPMAYFAGTFGIIIGADLPWVLQVVSEGSVEGQALSVGGAGLIDAVFMAGIFAIVLDVLLETYRASSAEGLEGEEGLEVEAE